MACPADRFRTPRAATNTELAAQLLPFRLPTPIAQALAETDRGGQEVVPPRSDIVIPGQPCSGTRSSLTGSCRRRELGRGPH